MVDWYFSIYEGNLNKIITEVNETNVNEKNNEGYTRLHIAVLYKKVNIVEFLLSQKAETNTQCNRGSSPLWFARNDTTLTKMLVDAGATIKSEPKKENNPESKYNEKIEAEDM